MTEYYTANRRGIQVSYECDDCGEEWTVDYDNPGDIPAPEEVPCPTPGDHDDYYCAGGCGCVAGDGCDCCTCSCEEGTRDEGCRNVWHEEDDEVVVSSVPAAQVPTTVEGQCACPECVKVRNLWRQSMLAAARPLMTDADVLAEEINRLRAMNPPPEDRWAHLKPPPT